MSDAEAIKGKVQDVFIRALDLPPGTNCEAMQYRQEPRWDSVAHLQLILELEREFGVVIGNEEVLRMTSFGDVLDTMQRQAASDG